VVAAVVGVVLLDARNHRREGFVIAFGSCTAYDSEKQAIWTDGVIPLAPDAWIWLGDLVYLDDPSVDCRQMPDSPQCDCESDWLLTSPFSCFAGNVAHARDRWQSYLSNADYLAFLDYMCPGSFAAGHFPPPGTDGSVCLRPILGVYDDHDFGWNNGNHREPDKQAFKLMFLDAIGEAANSDRRSDLRGAWGTHTLDANGVKVRQGLVECDYHSTPQTAVASRLRFIQPAAQLHAHTPPYTHSRLLLHSAANQYHYPHRNLHSPQIHLLCAATTATGGRFPIGRALE